MRSATARLEMAIDGRVQRVLAHGSAVIVEAPSGYGKSHLIDGLHAARPDAHLITTTRELQEAATFGPSSSLVLIDLDDLDDLAVSTLAASERTRTLVVAARMIGADIRSSLSAYECLELGVEELRLSAAETAALLFVDEPVRDAALTNIIHAQTSGWPAVVVALARHGIEDSLRDVVLGGISHHPAVDRFLASVVDTWPAEIRSAVDRFATIDRLTVAAFDDVSRRGLAGEAVRVGVPLGVRPDGWIELPAVMREHLGSPSAADASVIAPHLARSGGLVPAVRALVASGCHGAAGGLLCDAPPELLDGTDGTAVLGLLDVVERHVDSPRLGLLRVRAHELLSDIVGAEEVAARVVRQADVDTSEHVDAQLELARIAAMRGETTDLEPWIEAASTPEQHVRLDEIAAIQRSQHADPSVVAEGARGLARVAAGWEALGYNARASRSLRVMASVPLTHLGEYGEAIDAVMHARRLAWNRLFDRAACTAFLARAAGLAGRIDLLDREVNAAMELADSVPVPWLRLYVNWARVLRAGWSGDAAAVAEAAVAAERTLDGLEAHSTATVLFAELAVANAMVGQHDRATEYLARAVARRSDNQLEVDIASQIVGARAGRRTAASTQLDALRNNPAVPASRLWRVELESALVNGDESAAKRAVSAVAPGCEDAARLVVDQMQHCGERVPRVRITVMGELSVAVGGQPIPVPSGKPGDLLMLLATHRGPVPTELLIDALWPEADIETGLRRLKNPVNRLRAVLGPESVIRRGGCVALGPAAQVDLREFETHSTTALARHDDETGVGAAIRALNLYAPLLPGARFEAVSAAALAAQSRAASLLDLVIAASAPTRPPSSWLLSATVRIDEFDDARLLRIAEIARAEDNIACARRCLAEVRRIADDLDVPLSAGAVDMEDELASTE